MATTLINPLYPRPHIVAGTNSVGSGFMLTISSTSTATAFLATNFDSGCEVVFLDVQTANVLVTFDGSTPGAGTSGHILASSTNYTWQLGTLLKARFTCSSTTATIYASQFSM